MKNFIVEIDLAVGCIGEEEVAKFKAYLEQRLADAVNQAVEQENDFELEAIDVKVNE